MRARILAVVLASVAPGAGCDSVHSVAARAGIAGFEARCEASLPATRIEVVAAPVVYATDRTRSWRELTAMGDDMAPTQRAVGLTTAKLGDTVAVETSGIEDQSTRRVCVRPSVRVELTATPMTVYIGREIAGDHCRDAAALEHEPKHVAVYREELAHIAVDVRATLAEAYGNRVLYYKSRAEAKRATDAGISAEIGPLLDRIAGQIKARQREIARRRYAASIARAAG
jgi:hypothetical protein